MAHRATLHLGTATGENTYEILKMNYKFEQTLNIGPVHGFFAPERNNGMNMAWASGEVTGGVIELTIATLPDSDTIFHRWMFSRWRTMNGWIDVEMNAPRTQRQHLTINFTNGFCTGLEDNFDSQGGSVMTTKIQITCELIEIGTNIPAIWPAFI